MVQITDFGLGPKSVTTGFGCCTGDVEGIVGFVMPEKVEQALGTNYRFWPWAEIGNKSFAATSDGRDDAV